MLSTTLLLGSLLRAPLPPRARPPRLQIAEATNVHADGASWLAALGDAEGIHGSAAGVAYYEAFRALAESRDFARRWAREPLLIDDVAGVALGREPRKPRVTPARARETSRASEQQPERTR